MRTRQKTTTHNSGDTGDSLGGVRFEAIANGIEDEVISSWKNHIKKRYGYYATLWESFRIGEFLEDFRETEGI